MSERSSEDEKTGHDYESGSPEDQAHDAPTGKEAVTEEDEKLPEDQAAFQPDSS
jgi:hypothetical protein